jgi:hypothetical protein
MTIEDRRANKNKPWQHVWGENKLEVVSRQPGAGGHNMPSARLALLSSRRYLIEPTQAVHAEND